MASSDPPHSPTSVVSKKLADQEIRTPKGPMSSPFSSPQPPAYPGPSLAAMTEAAQTPAKEGKPIATNKSMKTPFALKQHKEGHHVAHSTPPDALPQSERTPMSPTSIKFKAQSRFASLTGAPQPKPGLAAALEASVHFFSF